MAKINGTNGADAILGTPQDDLIRLFDGDDLANGLAGDDWLRGMNGDDTLIGGEGDDTLGGALGDDLHIDLDGENSTVYASKGNDQVIVELRAEDDQPGTTTTSARLYGDDGNDIIDAKLVSKNTLGDYGGYAYAATSIRGGDGDDVISAEAIRENYFGGGSTNVVFGDDGDDTMTLRALALTAADAFINSYGEVENRAFGGTGNDAIELFGESGNVVLNVASGGTGNDELVARDHGGVIQTTNELDGGAGNDALRAEASADVTYNFLFGGAGDDILFGDVFGLHCDNELDGGDGDDWLVAQSDSSDGGPVNQLNGGAGNDTLEATALGVYDSSVLIGGAGDDFLTANGGQGNILDGGLDNDRLTGSENMDTFVLRAGDGTDTVTNFQDGIDRFGLAGDLGFADLDFTAVNGNTVINAFGEELAIVEGLLPEAFSSFDFTTYA